MFAYNLCAGLLRAIGNSFMPLVFLILSSVLNVILDLWFIAVLGMGVAGAGVATVISQGVSVALCILYVFRSARLLLPEKKHFHVESRLYWELFSQSISMGLMSSIVSAGSVVLQYGINGLGTLVIAGHTAARKLFAFTDMPLTAMASACSTYVSQNYGANHPDRVRRGMRDIYLYGVVVAVTAILLMSVGAEWMVKLVSGSSEPVVLENGARYLVWNAPFYAVLGMLLSTRYALQSMGEKVLPLLSSVIEFLGKIVFVLLFIPRFEYNAVILCEPVIWCFMTIELLIAYRHNSFVFPKMKKIKELPAMQLHSGEKEGGKISDSEGRIAEAVHQRVNVLARLAHGAVAAVEAGVVGQAGGVEDGGDRDAQTLVGSGEDGRQARHGAAVVVDRLDGRLHGVAGGDGGRQDEDVLALDHRGEIVAEDDLASAGVLGGDD